MNLEDLRDRVAFRVGFKSGTPSQAFAGPSSDQWKHIDAEINEAYRDEVNLAVEESGEDWLRAVIETTWPQDQTLFELPDGIQDSLLLAVLDITDDDSTGSPIWFGEPVSESSVTWRDSKTMEWRGGGPGSDKSLRIYYVKQPKELRTEEDAPDLIPERFHHLLTWTAAIRLREIADESAPQQWYARAQDIRASLHKQLSLTRPLVTGARRIDSYLSDHT